MSTSKKQLVTISARVPRSQAEEVERLANEKGVDRSAVVRGLLARGIREQRTMEVLELLRLGKVTVWKAAEMTGLTYREVLDILRTSNVPFPLSSEEMKREIKEILAGE